MPATGEGRGHIAASCRTRGGKGLEILFRRAGSALQADEVRDEAVRLCPPPSGAGSARDPGTIQLYGQWGGGRCRDVPRSARNTAVSGASRTRALFPFTMALATASRTPSFRTMTHFHGCTLKLEGERRVSSSTACTTSSGTGSAWNRLTALRLRIKAEKAEPSTPDCQRRLTGARARTRPHRNSIAGSVPPRHALFPREPGHACPERSE